jgi:2-amino-4-hydroxy-6-hydroxymethyldihydropteridine diphosphokinase
MRPARVERIVIVTSTESRALRRVMVGRALQQIMTPSLSSEPRQHTAYVALGSNLGNRLGHLRAATAALGMATGVGELVCSPLYETAAVADEPQPDYLNAVARLGTTLPPRELLELCLDIERRLGRVRPPGQTKAPRVIDLDLLLHGEAVVDEPGLELPHPGLLYRAFVRIPLAQVAALGLRHPLTGESLDRADDHPDVRMSPLRL